jgi:hypothetical protein
MPEGFSGYHALVLLDPDDPYASRRFKMMALIDHYGAYKVHWKGRAFVPLYSPDGLRWRVAEEVLEGNGKVFSPKVRLVTNLEGTGLYRWKGLYYLTGQGIGQGYAKAAVAPYERHIQIYRSRDLIHWSETQTMEYARQGQFRRPTHFNPTNNEQTHEGVSVWNRGNVLLGLTGFWHGAEEWKYVTHDLGLIISNDGLHFREPISDFIFAACGEEGKDWDEAGLAQGQGFENVGDKTYIWYGRMDQREGVRSGRPWKRLGGIGLLVADRDRFGYLSVRDPLSTGTFITADLKLDGPARVWVNAEGLGPDSSLRLELLDLSEKPLSGFSGDRAAVVQQSGLRVPVSWSGRNELVGLQQPFKIKAAFEGASRGAIAFYALYVGK